MEVGSGIGARKSVARAVEGARAHEDLALSIAIEIGPGGRSSGKVHDGRQDLVGPVREGAFAVVVQVGKACDGAEQQVEQAIVVHVCGSATDI